MSHWHIWAEIRPGAFEYLGRADGETFEDACRRHAQASRDFRQDFEPEKMTFNGHPLVPLDRRIDGVRVQFGAAGDR